MNNETKITIQNLLTVKSIVTIITTIVFAYLSIVGVIDGEQYLSIFIMIIGFYFGTQSGKKQGGEDNGTDKG